MKNNLILRKALMVAMMAAPVFAWATPPTGTAYFTDPQNSYVQDETSDGISQLNMVMCIMNSMKPAAMVNKGPYVALVDMNKCDSKKQSSTSNATAGASGATAAPNYMNAVVDVTRTDASTPMLAKIWMSMTEEGFPIDIFVHMTATTSPADQPPYGTFRVDYIGKSSGTTMFNGFIDASGADISYLENSQNGPGGAIEKRALAMTSSSTDAGSGTMETPDSSGATTTTKTFNFAYDSSETTFTKGVFRRDDGTSDVCFDRDKNNTSKSTWRYGTYNANDGTRVDTANPGFPVTANDGSNSYYGYAGYWGIDFQGLDLNSLPDGVVSNVTVTDQRPGNTTTYTLHKNSGKLTRWAQNQSTLTAMDGIPFNSWLDLTGQTSDSNVTQGSWQMKWDDANSQFVVLGKQTCGSSGCTLTALTPTLTVTAGAFANQPLNGWSDSFGGNINIPSTGSAHAGNDNVDYYTQSDVLPGATVPTLSCVSNCPTTASLTGFNGSNSPYDSNTDSTITNMYGMATTPVSYSFGAQGLSDTGPGGGVLAGNVSSTLFTGQYQYGIQSGRLFLSTDLVTGGNCPSSYTCEPNNPTAYYTWQTGADQWNQTTWLTKTSDSSVVSFDSPQNVSYTVPTDAAYGTWAGKTLQLQFSGFGNLQGIPGGCVDPSDNSATDCSTANARYVPAFSIPDGATMTLNSTPLIVKSLDSELRLGKIASCTGVELAQPTTPQTLPSNAELHDPSSSLDPFDLGTKPAVTDAPKVIDGVIQ